jgi:hypothetical protein
MSGVRYKGRELDFSKPEDFELYVKYGMHLHRPEMLASISNTAGIYSAEMGKPVRYKPLCHACGAPNEGAKACSYCKTTAKES